MFAYDCPNPVKPHVRADGELHRCVAEEAIRSGSHFFWRNAEGRYVAVCNFRPNGDLAGVGLVYTRKEYRRKHYAQNLVYQVTQMAKDTGYIPMLYTDADYVAATDWNGVSAKKKAVIDKKITAIAKQIVLRDERVKPSLKTKGMFYIMRMMQKKGWNSRDVE